MQDSSRSTIKTAQIDPFGVLPIKRFISNTSDQLQLLAELLKQEHELLIQGTPDQISEIAQKKLSCMQKISKYVSEYFDSETNTTNSSKSKLEDCLQSISEVCLKNKIKEWDEFIKLINYCHDLSDENSILLANRLKYTSNAIDTLYSLAGSPQNKTYDNKGFSHQSRSSRQLASV